MGKETDRFNIRHYSPETDVSTLSQLLIEIESHDRDGENTSEEYLRSMSAWPNFDPDQNVWVAEADGQMVGFGQVLPKTAKRCSIYIAVHPSQREKGLGSQLLNLVLTRASETQSKTGLVYANGYNSASTAFLQKHGFVVVGQSGTMFAPVAELPAIEVPVGYSLHRYETMADAGILVKTLNDCYRDMWGHQQEVESAERYIEYYGVAGIHLLIDSNGDLIGVCAAKPAGKQDERGVSDLLDAPGVIQKYRHQDFQRLMTLAVMHWLRGQGKRPITLEYWGDDEKTLNTYHELGFALVTQLLAYYKELE
jgi:mycothiol synthase